MNDRVYPASKPVANGGANPSFPATKSQMYGAARPTYRPQPHHQQRRSRRTCCGSFCCCLILVILVVLIAGAIAGAVIYLLYRPHRPSFTVTSLKLSYLNITSAPTLSSKFQINVTAENPNKKIEFFYKPVDISILSGDVHIGDGSIPGFRHEKKNTTLIKASIVSSGIPLDIDAASKLKSGMKSESGLPLEVKLDTKVKVKMGPMKSPVFGIRVSCDRIEVAVRTGKTPATSSTSNAKCHVDVRFKIWKWTIG